MWRQRLEDYEANSNARLQAATRGAQQKSQIREDIANQRATQQEAVAQSEITGEQGKSVQQIADDIGIPGVAKTTELLGQGLTSLGKRVAGRITTQEMLGLPKLPTLLQKSAPEAQVRDLTQGTTTYKAPVQEFDNPVFEPEQLDKDPLEVGEAGLKDLFGETDKAATTLSQRTGDVAEGQPGMEGDVVRVRPTEISADVGTEAAQAAEKVAGDITAQTAKTVSADVGSSLGETIGAGLGTVGDTLGALAGPVGFGLGLWGAAETIKDLIKGGKKYDAAVAQAKQAVASANSTIQGLQANVSANEFESKVGASRPQFGSLAATPALDTAKQPGVALTF